MNKISYSEIENVKNKIKSDINALKMFDDAEHYVEVNFQQYMRNGEYDDNSTDLGYNYKMLKEIEADERFIFKLRFVLSRYAGYFNSKSEIKIK